MDVRVRCTLPRFHKVLTEARVLFIIAAGGGRGVGGGVGGKAFANRFPFAADSFIAGHSTVTVAIAGVPAIAGIGDDVFVTSAASKQFFGFGGPSSLNVFAADRLFFCLFVSGEVGELFVVFSS